MDQADFLKLKYDGVWRMPKPETAVLTLALLLFSAPTYACAYPEAYAKQINEPVCRDRVGMQVAFQTLKKSEEGQELCIEGKPYIILEIKDDHANIKPKERKWWQFSEPKCALK